MPWKYHKEILRTLNIEAVGEKFLNALDVKAKASVAGMNI